MNEHVIKVLTEHLCYVATVGDGPNVVPIGYKKFIDDGSLILADVGMETTKNNILANGQIAVVACDPVTRESYMIKGTATYLDSGDIVDQLNRAAEKSSLPFRAKGAVIVRPEKVIVKHPGPDNNTEIE